MTRNKIMRIFLIVVIVFFVYLIALVLLGDVKPIVNYGFWLVLGVLLGLRLGIFLYEKMLQEESKERGDLYNKKLGKQGRMN